MANYYGFARSNEFAVKDVQAFIEELSQCSVEVKERGDNKVMLFPSDDYETGFPWEYLDETEDDYLEIPWEDIFARHLQDDWVAIVMEVGYEKLRYFGGFAKAWNNKGETRVISINDIEKLAEELGTNGTGF